MMRRNSPRYKGGKNIYTFIKYLLRKYLCLPGTLLTARDAAVNRMRGPCPQGTHNAVGETFNSQEKK